MRQSPERGFDLGGGGLHQRGPFDPQRVGQETIVDLIGPAQRHQHPRPLLHPEGHRLQHLLQREVPGIVLHRSQRRVGVDGEGDALRLEGLGDPFV